MLELVVAVNALGGGIYGLMGAKGVPREWLEGTPFRSYLIPSLVLLVAVAGSAAVAAGALIAAHDRASGAGIVAGVTLIGWIVVETVVIPFSWLQPTFFAIGIGIVTLGRRRRAQLQRDIRS